MPRLREPEYIEFSPADTSAVVSVMDELVASAAGWINLQPSVEIDDLPPPPGELRQLFSAKGPSVPLATWTPGEQRRDGTRGPVEVGVQHGTGQKARDALAEQGGGVPAGWPVRQDSPRRGLVVEVPPGTPHDEVLRWLLPAAGLLSEVPFAGPWRAAVFRT